ncbi:MAG: DUF349 domain-containing protein [Bacteroidales bacterium]|jgi:hypothetical protein|nr:DUF349 domain-containing protein [Bacteroidales bacterium]
MMTNHPKGASEYTDEEHNLQETSAVQQPEEISVTENTEETAEPSVDDEASFVTSEKAQSDYSSCDRSAMVEQLRQLVNTGDVDAVKDEIDAIKFHFYKKLKAEKDLERQQYIDGGGVEEDYVYEEDAQELILKAQLNRYREMRNVQREQMETEKQRHLEEKLKIIEELKELTGRSESIGENFQAFRELQNRWRATGPVPQAEVKNLWDTYHHYVEVFYDFIKINKELRDLDFKRNLEAKTVLCEKAEALLAEPSVVNAFHTLQNYHEQWHEIGPVPKDVRVEIWERFKAVSMQINKKHQDFFENLKETQKQNMLIKEAICEKVKEILQKNLTTMSQWEKSAKEIVDLQKQWNSIGFTQRKENNRIYKRFHTMCDDFFKRKREFFSHEKAEQESNLQLKEALCLQVEALKDSTEWKTATEEIIRLQKQWKETGSVPAKHRETIWKRFRAACDYFFEQKSKHYLSVDSEYEKNMQIKQDIIRRISQFVQTDNAEKDFEQLKDFQREWNETGFVPFKYKKKIQEEYRQALNQQFDALKLDKKDRNLLMYKDKLEQIATAPQSRGKIGSERERLVRKYQQLQNDLVVWENNIGFFSKSKNSASMIAGIERMIEQARTDIRELEEKIRMIDNFDNQQ